MPRIYVWQASTGCWWEAAVPGYIHPQLTSIYASAYPLIELIECPHNMATQVPQSEWGGICNTFYNITWGVTLSFAQCSTGLQVSAIQCGEDSTGTGITAGKSLQGSPLRLAIPIILMDTLPKMFFPQMPAQLSPILHRGLCSKVTLLKRLSLISLLWWHPSHHSITFSSLNLFHFSLQYILQTYLFLISSQPPTPTSELWIPQKACHVPHFP